MSDHHFDQQQRHKADEEHRGEQWRLINFSTGPSAASSSRRAAESSAFDANAIAMALGSVSGWVSRAALPGAEAAGAAGLCAYTGYTEKQRKAADPSGIRARRVRDVFEIVACRGIDISLR